MRSRLYHNAHASLLGIALALLPLPALAQGLCDDDAATCDDDAGGVGVTNPDGGPVPMADGDAGDAGAGPSTMDGGAGPRAACSCETDQDDDGRIHVCTDSFERDICEQFSCDLGTERNRGCPTREVRLCCEMPARGLQSRLYDDCTHPNCESGFREQCGQFGGDVHAGNCEQSSDAASSGDDSSGGFCAAAKPGTDAPSRALLAIYLACATLLLRRRA